MVFIFIKLKYLYISKFAYHLNKQKASNKLVIAQIYGYPMNSPVKLTIAIEREKEKHLSSDILNISKFCLSKSNSLLKKKKGMFSIF